MFTGFLPLAHNDKQLPSNKLGSNLHSTHHGSPHALQLHLLKHLLVHMHKHLYMYGRYHAFTEVMSFVVILFVVYIMSCWVCFIGVSVLPVSNPRVSDIVFDVEGGNYIHKHY